ncbi:MAG: c-type cytochrome [Candidatus Binataceae bacterium]
MKRTILAILVGLIGGNLVCMAPALAASGSSVFIAQCAVCHQPDAKGVEGIYPPLAGSIGNYVKLKQGREYVVRVPSFGLTGPIKVHGEEFSSTMPPLSQLSDEDIAAALNYVLTHFNQSLLPKDFKPLTADEVKGYRAASMSEEQVHAERGKLMAALKQAGDLK